MNKISEKLIPLYEWNEEGKGRVIVVFDPERHQIKNYYFDNEEDELPNFITLEPRYYHNFKKL